MRCCWEVERGWEDVKGGETGASNLGPLVRDLASQHDHDGFLLLRAIGTRLPVTSPSITPWHDTNQYHRAPANNYLEMTRRGEEWDGEC